MSFNLGPEYFRQKPIDPETGRPTAGINDYTCLPSGGREPVILLHGLSCPTLPNWATKAPILSRHGYCVYHEQHGTHHGLPGFQDTATSAEEVGVIVDRVLNATGASKVALVGYSKGANVAAYYAKLKGGQDKVSRIVAWGGLFYGTSFVGGDTLMKYIPPLNATMSAICPVCAEFFEPNRAITDLVEGGITVPGVDYTMIVTRYDEFVWPYTSGVIDEPGVTNIVLQDKCPLDLTEHFGMAWDPHVTDWMLWALKGKVDPEPSKCSPYMGYLGKEGGEL